MHRALRARRALALPVALLGLSCAAAPAPADVSAGGCTVRIWKPTFPWFDNSNITVAAHADIVCNARQSWDVELTEVEYVGTHFALVPNVTKAFSGTANAGTQTVRISPTTPRSYRGTPFASFGTEVLHAYINGSVGVAADDRGYFSNPSTAP
jgi:hypothetical protein